MNNAKNTRSNNDCRLDGNKAGNKANHRSTRSTQPTTPSITRPTTKAAKKAAAVVNLADIIMALESADDQSCGYLDRETGELKWLYEFEPEFSSITSEELEADKNGRYISLPDQYEINEYHMMEAFAYGHDEHSDRLIRAIQGRGAFQRFKNAVDELGLNQEWDEFRHNCYLERAVSWCLGNGLKFREWVIYEWQSLANIDFEAIHKNQHIF